MYIGALPIVSNRADWLRQFEIVDDDTNEAIDLTGASLTLELRDQASQCSALIASTDNGKITIVDTGVFQLWFSASDMRALSPATYDVGCTLTLNDQTIQYIIGTVPVSDGIVS